MTKTKIQLSLFLVLVLVLGFSVVGSAGAAAAKYKMGFAFYNLSNPVWAEVVKEAESYGAKKGIDVTYVDAGQDSAKQIAQIENFIQSGMDAICILAIDNAAVEDIAKRAREKGIYIIDYSRDLKNRDTMLNLDPKATGEALAKMASKWINNHFDPNQEVEWAFLNIPTVEVGVKEGQAVEDAMKRILPNSKLVARAATLTVAEGMKNTENILQAHPDLRVVLSLSAGGGVGGNEAIKAAVPESKYDSYGLFSIDATEQEVLNIINGNPEKASISLGSGAMHGRELVDLAYSLLQGKEVKRDNYLKPIEVTKENAQEYYNKIFGSKE